MRDSDYFLGSDGTTFLVHNSTNVYKVTGNERTQVISFEPNTAGVTIEPVLQKGSTVIFYVAKGDTAHVFDEEDYWYERISYYSVSLPDGEVKEITGNGEAGKVFGEGEFPQMDVSTARKPLAGDICNLFFRRYGKKGTEPMNHKSHGKYS